MEGNLGNPLSWAEALQITTEILQQAERERSEFAAWEAKRGLQWNPTAKKEGEEDE